MNPYLINPGYEIFAVIEIINYLTFFGKLVSCNESVIYRRLETLCFHTTASNQYLSYLNDGIYKVK